MIRLKTFFLLYVAFVLHTNAQRHNENWILGRDIWLNFSGPMVSPTVSTHPIGTRSGCISDTSGNFILVADSAGIRDALFQMMPGGDAATLGWGQPAQFLVLPKPAYPNRYYVLINEDLPGHRGGAVEVDMTLNNGMGAVVGGTIWYAEDVTAKLAATPNASNTGYWIMQHKDGTDAFESYQLTAAGIDPQPVITHAGSDFLPSTAPTESMDFWGPMKFNIQGDLLAMVTHGPPPDTTTTVEVYEFDAAIGAVASNPFAEIHNSVMYVSYDIIGTDTIYDSIPQWYPFRHFMGLEFDTTGQYLYLAEWDTIPGTDSTNSGNGWFPLQVNLGSMDQQAIQASLIDLNGIYSNSGYPIADRHGSEIELAPNGQLIFRLPFGSVPTFYYGNQLPEVYGSSLSNLGHYPLFSATSMYGLPTFCKRYLGDSPTWVEPERTPRGGDLTIRPQPMAERAVLDMHGLGYPDHLKWFDAVGHLVREESALIDGPTVVLARGELTSGLYLVVPSRNGQRLGQARVLCE